MAKFKQSRLKFAQNKKKGTTPQPEQPEKPKTKRASEQNMPIILFIAKEIELYYGDKVNKIPVNKDAKLWSHLWVQFQADDLYKLEDKETFDLTQFKNIWCNKSSDLKKKIRNTCLNLTLEEMKIALANRFDDEIIISKMKKQELYRQLKKQQEQASPDKNKQTETKSSQQSSKESLGEFSGKTPEVASPKKNKKKETKSSQQSSKESSGESSGKTSEDSSNTSSGESSEESSGESSGESSRTPSEKSSGEAAGSSKSSVFSEVQLDQHEEGDSYDQSLDLINDVLHQAKIVKGICDITEELWNHANRILQYIEFPDKIKCCEEYWNEKLDIIKMKAETKIVAATQQELKVLLTAGYNKLAKKWSESSLKLNAKDTIAPYQRASTSNLVAKTKKEPIPAAKTVLKKSIIQEEAEKEPITSKEEPKPVTRREKQSTQNKETKEKARSHISLDTESLHSASYRDVSRVNEEQAPRPARQAGSGTVTMRPESRRTIYQQLMLIRDAVTRIAEVVRQEAEELTK